MRTAAFIPVKLQNERFPGKNIKKFRDGTPLICFVQKTLLQCASVDEVNVYCSDDAIREYMVPGVNFCRREKKYDEDKMTVNDMHASILEKCEADIYMIVHCTSPFIRSDTIERGIALVKEGKYDSIAVGKKVQEFIWKDNEPFNFTREYIPRTQDLEPYYIETNGMYIFTKESMEKNHCRIGSHPFMMELSDEETVDIDYYEDFVKAQMILDAREQNGGV